MTSPVSLYVWEEIPGKGLCQVTPTARLIWRECGPYEGLGQRQLMQAWYVIPMRDVAYYDWRPVPVEDLT